MSQIWRYIELSLPLSLLSDAFHYANFVSESIMWHTKENRNSFNNRLTKADFIPHSELLCWQWRRSARSICLCCTRLLFSEDTASLFSFRLPIKRITFVTLPNAEFGQISLTVITYYFRDVRSVSLRIQTTIYFYYQFPVPDSSLRCLNQDAVPNT